MTGRTCKKCGEDKELSSFALYEGYRRHTCNSCRIKGRNPEKLKQERSRTYNNNKTATLAKQKTRHATLEGKQKTSKYSKEYYTKNKNEVLFRTRKYRLGLKRDMVDAYGGECTCCGEGQIEFLTVEHLNNDGKAHRSSLKTSTAVYRDLKKRGYPSDYTVLCFNCNIAKSLYGSCPHQLALNKAPSQHGKGT